MQIRSVAQLEKIGGIFLQSNPSFYSPRSLQLSQKQACGSSLKMDEQQRHADFGDVSQAKKQDVAPVASMVQLGEEDKDLAQFWYEPHTLRCLRDQCLTEDVKRIALLSAPSLFFALEGEERAKAILFEFDRRWEDNAGFVFFNYRDSGEDSEWLEAWTGSFDLLVADPPNLQMSTLQQYVTVIQKLRRSQHSKILFVTSADWRHYLFETLGLIEVKFKPSMPSSVWSQCGKFGLFSNYSDGSLNADNPAAPIDAHEDGEEDYTGYYLGLPAHEI